MIFVLSSVRAASGLGWLSDVSDLIDCSLVDSLCSTGSHNVDDYQICILHDLFSINNIRSFYTYTGLRHSLSFSWNLSDTELTQ